MNFEGKGVSSCESCTTKNGNKSYCFYYFIPTIAKDKNGQIEDSSNRGLKKKQYPKIKRCTCKRNIKFMKQRLLPEKKKSPHMN